MAGVIIENLVDYLNVQSRLNAVQRSLIRLNIKIDVHGVVDFCFPEYVHEQIAKDEAAESFYWELPLSDKTALALACTEEDRNNHIDDEEIDYVNKFFGFKITRNDISRMHSKYI